MLSLKKPKNNSISKIPPPQKTSLVNNIITLLKIPYILIKK
jgi:hypothetical protein